MLGVNLCTWWPIRRRSRQLESVLTNGDATAALNLTAVLAQTSKTETGFTIELDSLDPKWIRLYAMRLTRSKHANLGR